MKKITTLCDVTGRETDYFLQLPDYSERDPSGNGYLHQLINKDIHPEVVFVKLNKLFKLNNTSEILKDKESLFKYLTTK